MRGRVQDQKWTDGTNPIDRYGYAYDRNSNRLYRENEHARAAALDALSIADRAEYRLVQADCHNFLARLALDEGDKKTCRKEAGIARERALCDGPGHSYKPALDEADRLLAQL